jgi:two-component system response regulator DegU
VLAQFEELSSLGKPLEEVIAPLTRRETQILNYIAEGNTNKEIANKLEISEQTVKSHVSAILRKLNANDRAHAVALVMRQG